MLKYWYLFLVLIIILQTDLQLLHFQMVNLELMTLLNELLLELVVFLKHAPEPNLTKTDAEGNAASLAKTVFSGIARCTRAEFIPEIKFIDLANSDSMFVLFLQLLIYLFPLAYHSKKNIHLELKMANLEMLITFCIMIIINRNNHFTCCGI